MARAAATTDAFNAVVEPRRRRILDLPERGERPGNGAAAALGLARPRVSRHPRALRVVGLVEVRGAGRQRLHTRNADRLKAVYDWVRTFEPFQERRFDRIKERAEREAVERFLGRDDSKTED